MKNKILYLSILVLFLFLNSDFLLAQKGDECFKCHLDLDDEKAILYKTDIHHLKGISCASCHGGDATTDDMDIAAESIRKKFSVSFI